MSSVGREGGVDSVGLNYRMNVTKGSVFLTSTERTTSCNTGIFVLCAKTPRGAEEGRVFRLGVSTN